MTKRAVKFNSVLNSLTSCLRQRGYSVVSGLESEFVRYKRENDLFSAEFGLTDSFKEEFDQNRNLININLDYELKSEFPKIYFDFIIPADHMMSMFFRSLNTDRFVKRFPNDCGKSYLNPNFDIEFEKKINDEKIKSVLVTVIDYLYNHSFTNFQMLYNTRNFE
ncbi:hypothetical protein HOK68_00090 [Candidatus Woesearchaeota archaeon]|jgi:hypothetical protein|nr:hypothetical protein [Candidatus Woesearchaeota archaeon]MBT4387528.1 hypothetical protein [Candidatus Woesearchaeota archaeon]MBT4595370.1 hypothetical protein [Candidatus Woesearchaeota archaeon]MBT5741225.1 hypothetical protein [Candidatus Woesearchaeota archaeon]MBT6505161.1 hypothetical protein [Candidatus Woesearchaeota archaeon]